MAIISIENVNFAYNDGPTVLENVNLTVEEREFIGIIGPNGGGKTTLLKLILGLLRPLTGSITTIATNKMGYVSQFKNFNLTFPICVKDVVLMGRLGQTNPTPFYSKKDKKITATILEKLAIANLTNHPISTLSGGQIQRVMIARALVSQPEILLLDEPTANIDIHAEKNLFDLLKLINEEVTILVVSHDIGFISQYIKRVACVNKKVICHDTYELTPEILHEIYGLPVRIIKHNSQGGEKHHE